MRERLRRAELKSLIERSAIMYAQSKLAMARAWAHEPRGRANRVYPADVSALQRYR